MENPPALQTDTSLKLMDRVHQGLSYYQYSYGTEQTYCRWIKEYIKYLGARQIPQERFQMEVGSFLTFLEKERQLSGSSQKQALNAIIFLYKRVLDIPIDIDIEPVKVRKYIKLPVVMTKKEAKHLLSLLKRKHLLMARLLYGAGLRLMECVRLRVHNLNFKRNIIYIDPVKGGRDRKVVMPKLIREDLLAQVETIRKIHDEDKATGYGKVEIPEHLKSQYAGTEDDFVWQYVFPAKKVTMDTRTGLQGRSHVLASGLQKAVGTALKRSEIEKKVTCNTFRHSFATHMLENNTNINIVQEMMGHLDIKSTQMYIQLMDRKDQDVFSPLDLL
jgi:integron integrase